MALVACLECNAHISDQAVACPHCGAPVRRTADAAGVVTTQQTAKRYKAAQLVGALCIAAGVVACTADQPGASFALIAVGFTVYLVARLRAWWSHG